MKKTPILVAAAIIAVSFYGSVQAQSLEIQLNSHTYTNGYEVSCHGAQNGSIEAICVNGQEPYAYVWSNGATTQTINNVAAGTYTVTVYDWNNNSGQKEMTLREPDVLEAFLTADVCAGGTNICEQGASTGHIYSEIRGGSPPYSYLWNTGSESQTLDAVSAGTYTLTVTDINGCTSAHNITLTEPSALHIVSITSPLHHGFNISCTGQSDGVINLTVAGGVPPYSFQWNNGSMDQNPQGLTARVYMVKVYDTNGVMVLGQITLTQPPVINVNVTPFVYGNGFNLSAFNSLDGSITTNVTGGAAPYTYTWQTLPQRTTANIYNLPFGAYELYVYDANGCLGSASNELRQPERDDWTMNGNYGTNPAAQFLGTLDNQDLSFRTNNLERLSLNANGDIKMNSLKSDSATNKYRYVTVDDNGKLKANYISYCPGTLPPNPLLLGGNIIDVTNPQLQYIGSCNWADVVFGTSASERMRLKANGFFGIGVTSPVKFLDVQGSGRFRNYTNTTAGTTDIGFEFGYGLLETSNDLRINFYSDKNVIIGQADCRIGIGTTTPIAKLDVFTPATATDKAITVTNATNTAFLVYGNGQVYAREVTVKTGTFPDYVFAKDYSLLPLNDLAEFIKTNNHLPEMPTATEVEINGQALGEVQTLLVKKVEELTLYLIEQNKRIAALEKNNQQLNEQLKTKQSHK